MIRMLYIAHRIPFPPNKGDKIRSFNELKSFSKEYEIDLLTFVDYKSDLKYKQDLAEICSNIYVYKLHHISGIVRSLLFFIFGKSLSEGFYYRHDVYTKINSLLKKRNYKIIFCYSAQIAQYVLRYEDRLRIMDFVDVDSDKWRQYGRQKKFPLNRVYYIEGQRLLNFEKAISKKFLLSIFSTEQERRIFRNSGASGNIIAINNGVDTEFFSPQHFPKENALVFVGAMDYFPNIDAVQWFTDSVFLPLLRRRPDIKFYIVGSNPVHGVKKLANLSPNIIVTGFVKDVRPYLARSKMAVMPIRIARGIQNKILEAMAMRIPVILNEKLYKTLHPIDKRELFIYRDADDLLDIINNTIDNDSLLMEKGKLLREYVKKNYNWNINITTLKDRISQLTN